MVEKAIMPDRNEITVSGRLIDAPVWDISRKRCEGRLAVERKSGCVDVVPFLVGGDAVKGVSLARGTRVLIAGALRMRPRCADPCGPKWMLAVVADAVRPAWDVGEDANTVSLTGTLRTEPAYRETPLGREITDFMLSVERPAGGMDHIPCVAWGLTARWAAGLEVGDRVTVEGRFRSREYRKALPGGERTYTTFEVSAGRGGVRRAYGREANVNDARTESPCGEKRKTDPLGRYEIPDAGVRVRRQIPDSRNRAV